MKTVTLNEIELFVAKATHYTTAKEAFKSNPILFAVFQLVQNKVIDLYEFGRESHLTEKMTSERKMKFLNDKTVEQMNNLINNHEYAS